MSPKKAEATSPKRAVTKTASLDIHVEGDHSAVEKQISEPAAKAHLVGSVVPSLLQTSAMMCVAELSGDQSQEERAWSWEAAE